MVLLPPPDRLLGAVPLIKISFIFNWIGRTRRLLHNHPSGDPTPSQADIAMTREIQRAAAAIGITLHDHLVIGRAGHASFKSLGLL
jgi:hypothetical protein